MNLPAPRVIAIDDEAKHLEGLVRGLNRYGVACLPVHFTGEPDIATCSHVRVIFADLHITGASPGDHAQDFGAIGGLIQETIQPSGPYFIVLWTMYPDQADKLNIHLAERLQNVTKPITVQALDKKEYLNPEGDVKEPKTLVEAIGKIVAKQPQIAALLNWEERVLSAASDTVLSITELAESAAGGASPSAEVGRLLGRLAVEAVGGEHVEKDRFRAVNDALLPILADRIASMRLQEADNELWQDAFAGVGTEHQLTQDEAAKLNRLLHIEHSTSDGGGGEHGISNHKAMSFDQGPATTGDNGGQRGAVIRLPEEFQGEAFVEAFDLPAAEAMEGQFGCKISEEDDDRVRWVLVQTQAACDHAQDQPGPLPFHLGLCLPASRNRKKKPPAALWRSPCFEYERKASFLHVNARFTVSWRKEKARSAKPLFRLREQLLNDLIYHLHGYGARPGIIRFSASN